MMSAPALRYRCEKLRLECVQAPCDKNLAKAREHRDKFAHAMLPYPLDLCTKCKGKELLTLEAPLEATGRQDLTVQVEEIMAEYDGNIIPEVTKSLAYLDTTPPSAPIKDQFCKNHPEIEAHKNKHGGYMGLCRECLAARAAENSWNRGKLARGKMTRSVARDLEKAKEVSVAATKPAPAPPVLSTNPPGTYPGPEPTCNNHPGSPAKIDSLGRSMGLCSVCLSARGRKAGIENARLGKTSPPIAIPLNQPRFADLKAWLEAQAEENERSLLQEIMFRLKISMRVSEKKN